MTDAYDLWLAHQDALDREESKLPVCHCCKQAVQEDIYYKIDGKIYCPECLRDRFGHYIGD